MGKSLNICLSCGICCDGTLLGFVQLESEERSRLRKLMDIEEVGDKGFFFQPCSKLGCNGCTIYPDRPKKCGEFQCKMLKAFEKKELDFDSAISVINLVKQKRMTIEKHLTSLPVKLQSRSFYFKILELKNLLRQDKFRISLSEKHENLLSEIQELDQLAGQYFGIAY
ncbi:MAG: YkgJ family cysteine cluster protein [bacterium]